RRSPGDRRSRSAGGFGELARRHLTATSVPARTRGATCGWRGGDDDVRVPGSVQRKNSEVYGEQPANFNHETRAVRRLPLLRTGSVQPLQDRIRYVRVHAGLVPRRGRRARWVYVRCALETGE